MNVLKRFFFTDKYALFPENIVLQEVAKSTPLFPNLSKQFVDASYAYQTYKHRSTLASYYDLLLHSFRAQIPPPLRQPNVEFSNDRLSVRYNLRSIFKRSRKLRYPSKSLVWIGFFYVLLSGLSLQAANQSVGEIDFSSFFKTKSKTVDVGKVTVRFKDVIGIEEFKEELTQLVDYLKNPEKYKKVGAKLPRGILLEGSPGTGKTLLAKALAGEAGCRFIYKSGADFDEVFVGVGAERVRELFQLARVKTPCIIFIDEIDSIAGKRSKYLPGVYRAALNQLLTEMDGFSSTDNIIVIGATNLSGSLDPAIKRPGRFDRTITIPLPDVKGREQILDFYKAKVKIHKEAVPSKGLAKLSVGFSGADLQNLVNIAILNAVKNNRDSATDQDFDYAFDRVKMGIGRKSLTRVEDQIRKVAYHEAGHALVGLLSESNADLHKITILPRGGAMGFTASIPKDEIHLSKKEIQATINTCLGGRAAQEIIFGDKQITTGCSSDLMKATSLAYGLVKSYGMQQDLTVMSPSSEGVMSDQFKFQIDYRVKEILDASYLKVRSVLEKNKHLLEKLAEELIKEETLDRKQVKDLLNL